MADFKALSAPGWERAPPYADQPRTSAVGGLQGRAGRKEKPAGLGRARCGVLGLSGGALYPHAALVAPQAIADTSR